MKFRVLDSGSSGNCYLLESDTEVLIIEAGIKFKEVIKAIDFEIGKIVGLICSHVHSDHFGFAHEYLKAGIPVYASEQTHSSEDNPFKKVIHPGYWYKIGNFNVTPFPVVHDVECYGFIIRHEKIGTMLFATDTEYIKQSFKALKLNHVAIECNYSQKIIDERVETGSIVKSLRDRIFQSHMSFETCKGFIEANRTSSLYNIVLLHLSDGNSNEFEFREEIKEIVGAGTEVFVAGKGLEINLDLCPF